MEKELPALENCVTTGNLRDLSKRQKAMFHYLRRCGKEAKSPPSPEPVDLLAMVCTGMTKEMFPLHEKPKVDPAMDYLTFMVEEGETVADDEIESRPIVKVRGDCEYCQQLLNECPTPVGSLKKTEVLCIMMPWKWDEPSEVLKFLGL